MLCNAALFDCISKLLWIYVISPMRKNSKFRVNEFGLTHCDLAMLTNVAAGRWRHMQINGHHQMVPISNKSL